jgi:hypothetical protein
MVQLQVDGDTIRCDTNTEAKADIAKANRVLRKYVYLDIRYVLSVVSSSFSSSSCVSFRPVSPRLVNGDAVILRVPTVEDPLGRRGLFASLRVGR